MAVACRPAHLMLFVLKSAGASYEAVADPATVCLLSSEP
jgi:hypothetical protein